MPTRDRGLSAPAHFLVVVVCSLIAGLGFATTARAVGLPTAPLWLVGLIALAIAFDRAGTVLNLPFLKRPGFRWLAADGRVGLLRGCVLFTVNCTGVGVPFLLPFAATMVATTYLHRSGSRGSSFAVGATTGTSLAGLLLSGVLAHHGVLVFPLSTGQLLLIDSVFLGLGLGIVVSTAAVVAEREAGEAALAAERADRHAELLHAASHDALTGVLNRTGLSQVMAGALASAAPGAGVALLYLDLDGFKAVNDTLGHQAGDELLSGVAERLRATVRPQDAVARLGGDEFVVLVTEITDAAALADLGERTEGALMAPYVIQGLEVRVGVSIGTAVTDAPLASTDELFARADAAMYAVKSLHHREAELVTSDEPVGTRPLR